MNTLSKTLSVVTMIALAGCLTLSFAQAPPQNAPKTFEGELLKVNAETHLITVKPATGSEMEFTYGERTEIAGAEKGAQGLATRLGAKVRIQYTTANGVNTASKIEIVQ
jgi:hypothetical protein